MITAPPDKNDAKAKHLFYLATQGFPREGFDMELKSMEVPEDEPLLLAVAKLVDWAIHDGPFRFIPDLREQVAQMDPLMDEDDARLVREAAAVSLKEAALTCESPRAMLSEVLDFMWKEHPDALLSASWRITRTLYTEGRDTDSDQDPSDA